MSTPSSARPDAKAVIEQRYGKAGEGDGRPAAPSTAEICSPASTYTVSPDGLMLTAEREHGRARRP